MKRKPCVAGTFYPGQKDDLLETIERLIDPKADKKRAVAVVAPHAGYEYSGPVAGAVFSSVVVPPAVVVLGPAHREIGSLFAIQNKGSWLTPLGETPIEPDLAALIAGHCPLVTEDDRAHLWEHSLEVELPFIQYFEKQAALVPICISYEAGYGDLETLGRALAAAVLAYGRPVLIVSSSDMSHYVSQKTAEKKDSLAIRKILELDARGLFETVRGEGISMCGYQPTTSVIVASRELGAVKAELIKYQTSGEATGDFAQVVGYAGIRIV
jgi:AmmeMemoRadiSam system protein B